MTDIYYSRVLDAPIEKVWQIVGDFGALGSRDKVLAG